MTNMVNENGYTRLQKIQHMLATGLTPIIIALGLLFLYRYPIGKDKEDEIEAEMLVRHSDL